MDEAKKTPLEALIAIGTKILAKLDSETGTVTQWDADALRDALTAAHLLVSPAPGDEEIAKHTSAIEDAAKFYEWTGKQSKADALRSAADTLQRLAGERAGMRGVLKAIAEARDPGGDQTKFADAEDLREYAVQALIALKRGVSPASPRKEG